MGLEDSHTLLEESTVDILMSVLKEVNPKGVNEKDINNSEAYVIIHRDNPKTKEILGSINMRVPFKIDKESKSTLDEMNIPTDSPFLTCFGSFDATDPTFETAMIRCTIRNEHGYPISYGTQTLIDRTDEINKKIKVVIKKEVMEDINKIL